MSDRPDRIELSIDTAGAMAGVAISRRGVVLVELTWRTHQNHSVELLPAIDRLLTRAGVQREEIGVIFVNRGPGSYAGLRVGISTAMGLSLGLSADLLSVGRLELDAFPHSAYAGPIVAVHQAGRGDIAWAVYQQQDRWRELQEPTLAALDTFLANSPPVAFFCGELDGLEVPLSKSVPGARLAEGNANLRRAGTLAGLGWFRYSQGARDNPVALEPLYLREAHITQPRRQATMAHGVAAIPDKTNRPAGG